jgi:hypothetical protein
MLILAAVVILALLLIDIPNSPRVVPKFVKITSWLNSQLPVRQAVAAPGGWNIETLVASDNQNRQIELEISSEGVSHILYAYPFTTLIHAYRDTAWYSDIVDKNLHAATPFALKLDSSDQPVAVYVKSETVIYAHMSGSEWFTETVAAGNYPDLALDSNDNPHIVFTNGTSVIYAVNDGLDWSFQTLYGTKDLDTITGAPVTIALDSQNRPHFCRPYSSLLYHKFWDGSAWQEELMVDTVSTSLSQCNIAVSSSGVVHASVRSQPPGTVGDLWYGNNEEGVWNFFELDGEAAGDGNSLAIDRNGNPHIAYYQNLSPWGVHYVHYDGTKWVEEYAGYGEFVVSTSLALNPDDLPSIAYINLIDYTYYYAWREPGTGILRGDVKESQPIGYVPCIEATLTITPSEQTLSTDDNGAFWTELNPGYYDIAFSKPGFITLTKTNTLITENGDTYVDMTMFREDCWSPGESCFNELVNVIPIFGAPSEATGFWNSLCEFGKRLDEDNLPGAVNILLPNILDIIDIPFVGDALDTLQGFFSCIEGLIYDALEQVCGEHTPLCRKLFSVALWQQAGVAPAMMIIYTEITSPPSGLSPDYPQADPLEVHVTSPVGHLGVVDGSVEHTIPNSYLFRAGGKYQIAEIRNYDTNYELEITGLEDSEYRLIIINPNSNHTGTLLVYEGLLTLVGSSATLSLTLDETNFMLAVDLDGDGQVDQYVAPSEQQIVYPYEMYVPNVTK